MILRGPSGTGRQPKAFLGFEFSFCAHGLRGLDLKERAGYLSESLSLSVNKNDNDDGADDADDGGDGADES